MLKTSGSLSLQQDSNRAKSRLVVMAVVIMVIIVVIIKKTHLVAQNKCIKGFII